MGMEKLNDIASALILAEALSWPFFLESNRKLDRIRYSPFDSDGGGFLAIHS